MSEPRSALQDPDDLVLRIEDDGQPAPAPDEDDEGQ